MLRPIIDLVTGMEAIPGGRSRSVEKWCYFEKHPSRKCLLERESYSLRREKRLCLLPKSVQGNQGVQV